MASPEWLCQSGFAGVACGRGLADQAAVPGRIADLMAAVAATLEAHIAALDAEDESAQVERRVYDRLAHAHRRIASELLAVREESDSLRDALAARKTIERAKGLLMERDGLSESEAFGRMRAAAQRTGKTLPDIAEAISETYAPR